MYINIKFLRSWTRQSESENKIVRSFFDGSAFAIVSLGAKQASATVLYMQFWTQDISFNIDLWLIKPEVKERLLFVYKVTVELKLLESAKPRSLRPDFSDQNWSTWHKKSSLYLSKVILKEILLWFCNVLRRSFMWNNQIL